MGKIQAQVFFVLKKCIYRLGISPLELDFRVLLMQTPKFIGTVVIKTKPKFLQIGYHA